nr:MAG TPA: hypothetical protein [Caudoviricetes sp.]
MGHLKRRVCNTSSTLLSLIFTVIATAIAYYFLIVLGV